MFMYTVKSGDTLYSIAKKYNTSVSEIIDLNYLTNSNLKVGQVIRIPEMYTPEDEIYLPQYTNYIVKKGDTLYSIASNNNISVDILKKDNALVNDSLVIGQSLKIRVDGSSYVEECFGEDYISEDNNYFTYTVKKGDSLYKIANSYNTSVSNIISLNNLDSDVLKIGQILKIPGTSQTTYIVKKGDNLYDIARRFNTSVDNIKKKNNLNSNLLSIGQKLII